MPDTLTNLRAEVDKALGAGKPEDAVCHLAEMVSIAPSDRHARLALAVALGDAGHRAGALKVMRVLADRLAHEGYLLPAMVVVRQGLERVGEDAGLLSTLRRLHVRGVRAKAGDLPIPPPLKSKRVPSEGATATALLAIEGTQRLERAAQIGSEFPTSDDAAIPLPLPKE